MGADLILAYAPIPAEPNWQAGAECIDALTPELADSAMLDPDDLEDARNTLRADLAELRRVIEAFDAGAFMRRDVDVLNLGQAYLITGGMSWGDAPTDFYEVLNRLGFTGVLAAAGFTEAASNAVQVRLA